MSGAAGDPQGSGEHQAMPSAENYAGVGGTMHTTAASCASYRRVQSVVDPRMAAYDARDPFSGLRGLLAMRRLLPVAFGPRRAR